MTSFGIGVTQLSYPTDLRNRRNLARGGYSSSPAPVKPGTGTPFASFSTAGGDELARRGGSDRVGARKSLGARRARLRLVEGRPVAHRLDPRRRRLILAGRPAPRLGGRGALGPSQMY